MAQFNGMVVTNKGRELLARALASKGKFIITAVALGDGAYSGNLRECEELVNKKLDLILMGVYSEKGSTKITVGITNKNVSESFRTNEIGVYAKLEGDAESVLYAYDVAVEADTMPNNSLGTTLELVYDIYFDVSSEVEVTLEITDSIAFLTQDIAKRDFVKTDIISGGNLKDKTQLEADKQYYADDGKWYQNIGGDRVWTAGNGVPDSLFKEISWKEINKGLNGKLDKYTLNKEDFNNYITNGMYYLIGDNTVPNAPTNNRGILLVAELGTVITQIFFPYFSAGEYYQRNFIIISGTWSEWKNPIIKSNSVTSDSTSDVATSLAVKTAYDTALKKAGKFVYDKTSTYPNVNDLKEAGIYYMNNDVLCPGSPHQNRAMMIVSDSTYPMQIWYPYFSQGVYYTRYWTGSSWSSWERSSSLEGSRNKYIIKDMTINFTTGAPQNFYFNNAFPNECLGVFIGDISNSGSNLETVQLYGTTKTGFTGMAVSVPEISPVAVTVKIMALGY